MLKIRLIAAEIILIIKEIEDNALTFHFQHAHISALTVVIHIEMGDIFKLILPLTVHAHIFGYKNTAVIVSFVKTLWQRTYNVSKTSCFNEGNALG
jgi:hypothetical protein